MYQCCQIVKNANAIHGYILNDSVSLTYTYFCTCAWQPNISHCPGDNRVSTIEILENPYFFKTSESADSYFTTTIYENIFTARKRSLRRLCFYRCLSFCPQGGVHGCSWGACVVAPRGACVVALGGACMVALRGVHGCSWGAVHGCFQGGGEACVVAWGACMVARGGHAWLLPGGCMVDPGGCVVAPRGGSMRGIWRDMEIRSVSGRYASYWNAFLLKLYFKFSGSNLYLY